MEDEKQLEIILDEPKTTEQEKKDEPVIVVEGEEPPMAAQDDDGDPLVALKKWKKGLKKKSASLKKVKRSGSEPSKLLNRLWLKLEKTDAM